MESNKEEKEESMPPPLMRERTADSAISTEERRAQKNSRLVGRLFWNDSTSNSRLINSDSEEDSSHRTPTLTPQSSGHYYGTGSAGEVLEVIDFVTHEILAEKCFNSQEEKLRPEFFSSENREYDEEKKINESIKLVFSNDALMEKKLYELAVLPSRYNDSLKTIYFEPGLCSLADLYEAYSEKNVEFSAEEIVHIFLKLLDLVILLKSKGYCHSDIKPANTTLIPVTHKKELYTVKVIDFGTATCNTTIPERDYTPEYFLNPAMEDESCTSLVFSSMEDRFKNEFFSIYRTIHWLMCTRIQQRAEWSFQHNTEDEESRENKLARITKLHEDLIKTRMEDMKKNEAFKEIMEFIGAKGINCQYEFEDLEKLCDRIRSKSNADSEYFHEDKNEVKIKHLFKEKIQTKVYRENEIMEFFGIENYVKMEATWREGGSNFDIIDKTLMHLKLFREDLVVEGEPGSGKSTFLLKLLSALKEEEWSIYYNIVFVSVKQLLTVNYDEYDLKTLIKNDINGSNSSERINELRLELCLKSKIEMELKLENEEKLAENVIVLLDGLDELAGKLLELEVASIIRKYSTGERVQIVATIRSNYASESIIEKCMRGTKDAKIAKRMIIGDLDKEEEDSLVEKFVHNYNEMKNYVVEFEIYENAQQYREIFDRYPELAEITKVPLQLTILLIVVPKLLPLLKNSATEASSDPYSKVTLYKIYEMFVLGYFFNEMKNFRENIDFRKRLESVYGNRGEFDVVRDIFDNKTSTNMLFEDLCEFNAYACLEMLNGKEEELKLTHEEVFKLSLKKEKSWSFLFEELASLTPRSGGYEDAQLNYFHKSIFEFFLAHQIIQELIEAERKFKQAQELEQGFNSLSKYEFSLDPKQSFLAKTLFVRELQVLRLAGTFIMYTNISFKIKKNVFEILENCITESRKIEEPYDPNQQSDEIEEHFCNESELEEKDSLFTVHEEQYVHNLSANAATLLNASAHFDFRGKDFSGCCFENACLSDADFSFSNLKEAKFANCILQNACFYRSDLERADLRCVKIASFPPLMHEQTLGIKCVVFSHTDRNYDFAKPSDYAIHEKEKYIFSKGNLLATSSTDGFVTIWDLEEMECIAYMNGVHEAEYSCVTFSPNDNFLAASGSNKDVILWQVEDDESWNESRLAIKFEGHDGLVSGLAFSPSGNYLASCARGDVRILLWSLAEKCLIYTFDEVHRSCVMIIAYSPCERFILSGGRDGKVVLWPTEPNLGEEIENKIEGCYSVEECVSLQLNNRRVTTVAFSDNGLLFAAGFINYSFSVWRINNLDSNNYELELMSRNDKLKRYPVSLAFVSNVNAIAVATQETCINLYCLKSMRLLQTFQGDIGPFNSVSFSISTEELAAGSEEGKVMLCTIGEQWKVKNIHPHDAEVYALSISGEPKDFQNKKKPELKKEKPEYQHEALLATSGSEPIVKLWNLDNMVFIREIYSINRTTERLIAFSPTTHEITIEEKSNEINYCSLLALASGFHNYVEVWAINHHLVVHFAIIKVHISESFAVTALEFSNDGKFIACGCANGLISIWNIYKNGFVEYCTLKNKLDQPIISLFFTPDGKLLVCRSKEEKFVCWNWRERKELLVKDIPDIKDKDDLNETHKASNTIVSISPNGLYLATYSAKNNCLYLISTSNMEIEEEFMFPYVCCLAWKAEGKGLIVAGLFKVIKIFCGGGYMGEADEINDGEFNVKQELWGHEGDVNGLAVTPDGSALVSVSSDRSVKLWNLEDPDSVAEYKSEEYIEICNCVSLNGTSNFRAAVKKLEGAVFSDDQEGKITEKLFKFTMNSDL